MTDWHDVAARYRTLVRDANERISAEPAPADQPDSTRRFDCECEDPACRETVSLTTREYECVRASPTRFLIMTNHEDPQIEHLVAENKRFTVVETLPGTMSKIALRTDPRATR